MGYELSWTLHRERPLNADERERARAHVLRWAQQIANYDLFVGAGDGVIAWYSIKPSHGDPNRRDHCGHLPEVAEQILEALAELRTLFHGVKLAVADDFGTYHWTGGGWDHSFDGDSVPLAATDDGWLLASKTPDERSAEDELDMNYAKPVPMPPGARPLVASEACETAIGEALALVATADPADRDGWLSALCARLALDGWTSQPWTAVVVDAITRLDARSAWRVLALATDAGLPDAARALSRSLNATNAQALAGEPHPAWRPFLRLIGIETEAPPPAGADFAQLAEACVLVGDSTRGADRNRLRGRLELLGFVVEPATQPLVRPCLIDDKTEIKIAYDIIAPQLVQRIAPYLVDALTSATREQWRQQIAAWAAAKQHVPDVAEKA